MSDPTPATVTAIQAALLARLQDRLGRPGSVGPVTVPAGVTVQTWSDDPESFRLYGQAAVLLGYAGGTYDDPQDSDGLAVLQVRTLHWSIGIVTRSLGGDGGAPALLDAVRLALAGWRPPACVTPIRCVRDDFAGQASGQWSYQLTVACETVAVALPDEPEEVPAAASEITWTGGPGGTFGG